MEFISYYDCVLGTLTLIGNDTTLKGLEFSKVLNKPVNDSLPIFVKTKAWLDDYFDGLVTEINELSFEVSGTNFQKLVWDELLRIPYGELITYGDIAKKIAKISGKEKMSAQAVGNAVGKNPLAIIIPCHRVIGANNNLTGFSGGMDKKIKLLTIEGHDLSDYKMPKEKK
ncbi:MAG: methylated-DNA--[protein]-cysteine S-methyltransferase [Acholeplasma sp.]|nr:methylated-DNA--[protein]-cysteine S-methyltransferase [Acholeplasma sp.]